MIRRIFWLFFGLGLGLLVGAFVMKRLDDATKAVAPPNLARRAGRAAGSTMSRLRGAMEEGSRAAAEREAELRTQYNVPTLRETLGQQQRPPGRSRG